MAERTVEMVSTHGLHAGPATNVTEAIAKAGGDSLIPLSEADSADTVLDELVALLVQNRDAE